MIGDTRHFGIRNIQGEGGIVPPGSISFAEIQNITTDRLVGRDSAGTGSLEQLTVGGGIEFTGTGIQTSAFTGDVTKAAGGVATTVANTIPKIVSFSTTEVTITNTVDETTVVDFTLPANSLSTGNMLEMSIYETQINNTGGNTSFTVKLYYDDTVIASVPTGNIGASATSRSGKITVMLKGAGATNAQYGQVDIAHAQIVNFGLDGTAAEDSTTALHVKVTITLSAASANLTWKMRGYRAKLIKA
jgi:hypothetical protein